MWDYYRRPESMIPVHRMLAELIPEIDCPPNCGKCCSYHLGLYLNEKGARLYGSTKPYAQYEYGDHEYIESETPGCKQYWYNSLEETKCKIYETRPLICRIFWKREGDPVCHGGLMPERQLTKEEFRRLLWCWQWGTIQDAMALKAVMVKSIRS